MRALHRRTALAATFLAVLLVPAALAGAPLGVHAYVVTGPTDASGDYVVEHVVVHTEGTLTLVNADLRAHDVVAVATGPDDNPWCGRFAQGDCPLFWSPLAAFGEQVPVSGIHQLTPLATYEFYCSIHDWMRGTIVAV